MKELPILFQTAMVSAILDGTKTQTRRIIKWHEGQVSGRINPLFLGKKKLDAIGLLGDVFGGKYQVGDLLWVRETTSESWTGSKMRGSGEFLYKTDMIDKKFGIDWKSVPWTPSIHMKKERCRIWLRVKRVWVERVNTISSQDSRAEGIKRWDLEDQHGDLVDSVYHDYSSKEMNGDLTFGDPTNSFKSLWDSINLKRDEGKYSWASNPWVWCIEFEVVSTTGKAAIK